MPPSAEGHGPGGEEAPLGMDGLPLDVGGIDGRTDLRAVQLSHPECRERPWTDDRAAHLRGRVGGHPGWHRGHAVRTDVDRVLLRSEQVDAGRQISEANLQWDPPR